MIAHSIFFFFFSAVAIFSAIMVTVSKNTVHSVLFLILDFITISCLFIMIGAEFLGMIMLIVYVGAVAVLFLFVVMMLNVAEKEDINLNLKKKSKLIPIGFLVGFIILVEMIIVVGGWKYKPNLPNISNLEIDQNITNTHAFGNVIYTEYIHLFQLSGMILLVAMIGAITLTFRKREGVKRQEYFKQVSRERNDSVQLVDVKNKEGVVIDD
tara:strand:- start:974 stop:1606 length:633 start_codon:yes stop_codon:yes gene_type:complete